jgi:hypothetical protein
MIVRKLIFLIFIILLAFGFKSEAQINDKLSIKAKEIKTDLEMNNLFGKVKYFREEFFINDENIGFKRYYNYYTDEYLLFNEQGYIALRKLFDKNGKVIYKKTLEYDLKNRIVTISEFDTTENISNKANNIYDSKGYLIETITESKNAKSLQSKFSYTDEGRVKQELVYYDNNLIKTSNYEYDAEITKKVTDSTIVLNNTQSKYKSKVEIFDRNGNMLEQTSFDLSGNISVKYVYKFDASNNNIQFSSYGASGVLEGDYNYKFDEKNNMIQEEKYLSNKKTTESIIYEYKYDAQGNWIERTTKHHNIPKNIIKRDIQYY